MASKLKTTAGRVEDLRGLLGTKQVLVSALGVTVLCPTDVDRVNYQRVIFSSSASDIIENLSREIFALPQVITHVPAGLSPIGIMLQGLCLAPNSNNPIFTTTDAHEIQIQ